MRETFILNGPLMWPIYALKLHSIAYICRYITELSQATIQSKSLEFADAVHTEETKLNHNVKVQNVDTLTKKGSPITRCSFEQRGAHLKSQCPNSSGRSLLERLERTEWNDTTKHHPPGLGYLPRTMFIDKKHELFICLVMKAGSTTYNSLMVQ